MQQDFPFLLYPYGTKSVLAENGIDFEYNSADQRIETYNQGQPVETEGYEIGYSEPVYSLTALRSTSDEDLAALPSEFDRYKQLPAELPQRVRDLAVEITADSANVYDKARAIESYFSTAGFEYSQVDIPVPEEDQDYVDQFLFETKKGYCDNYSTSMVVLLRSLDIPARWVKGFNEGELVAVDDGTETYQVTNNNAHSWVEAYMPGVGWMLFEPTIGFTGAAAIDFDVEVDQPEDEATVVPERPNQIPEVEDEVVPAAEDNEPTQWNRIGFFLEDNIGKILLGLAGIGLLLALLYRMRQKWLPKFLIPFYRIRGDDTSTFEKAYLRLLKQLDLYGIKRKDGQTLKSYAAYIDSFFGSHDMTKLTQAYERSVYGGKSETVHWQDLKESWENLIKQTSG
jgi:transglutaminase-like putative cysteine protease